MNWLCNPSGKVDGFRALDWLQELNNLYTKVMYAGSGKVRTLPLVIKQSPLIEIFRSIHVLIQDNFHMLHHSMCHVPPNLTITTKVLCDGLKKHHTYDIDEHRKVPKIFHHLQEGLWRIQNEKNNDASVVMGLEEEGVVVEMEDLDI